MASTSNGQGYPRNPSISSSIASSYSPKPTPYKNKIDSLCKEANFEKLSTEEARLQQKIKETQAQRDYVRLLQCENEYRHGNFTCPRSEAMLVSEIGKLKKLIPNWSQMFEKEECWGKDLAAKINVEMKKLDKWIEENQVHLQRVKYAKTQASLPLKAPETPRTSTAQPSPKPAPIQRPYRPSSTSSTASSSQSQRNPFGYVLRITNLPKDMNEDALRTQLYEIFGRDEDNKFVKILRINIRSMKNKNAWRKAFITYEREDDAEYMSAFRDRFMMEYLVLRVERVELFQIEITNLPKGMEFEKLRQKLFDTFGRDENDGHVNIFNVHIFGCRAFIAYENKGDTDYMVRLRNSHMLESSVLRVERFEPTVY